MKIKFNFNADVFVYAAFIVCGMNYFWPQLNISVWVVISLLSCYMFCLVFILGWALLSVCKEAWKNKEVGK